MHVEIKIPDDINTINIQTFRQFTTSSRFKLKFTLCPIFVLLFSTLIASATKDSIRYLQQLVMSYPAAQSLLTTALQLIDGSQEVTFAISQIASSGVTAIALMFNKVPQTTIEFGPGQGIAINPNEIGSGLKLNSFDAQNMGIIYVIRSFETTTLSQKNKTRQLFSDLLEVQMEMYNILHNNCHDYVMKAYDVIVEFGKGFLTQEELEIKQGLIAAIKPPSVLKSSQSNERTFQEPSKIENTTMHEAIPPQSSLQSSAAAQTQDTTTSPQCQKSLLSTAGSVAAVPIVATGHVAKAAGGVAKTGAKATAGIAVGTANLAAGAVSTAAHGTAHVVTGAVGLAADTVGTVADVGTNLISETANLIGGVFRKL